MKKRMKILAVLGCISMLAGCGDISEGAYVEVDEKEIAETAKDVVQEVADQTANIVDSENEHVLMVKNGHPESYPDITYKDAFENFFSYPTWKYFTGTKNGPDEDGDGKPDSVEENVDIVEFTGYCMYQNVEVKALIQFTLDKEAGTFTATYLSFNEVPQNNITLCAVIQAAFEGDDEGSSQQEETQTGQAEKPQDSQDIDEEQLQEFIELICSYSDPPSECSEEELQAFFKEEYLQWKNGEEDSNIIVGEDGHLKLKPRIDKSAKAFPILFRGYENSKCPVMVHAEEAYELKYGTYDEMIASCVNDGMTMYAPPVFSEETGTIYTATKWDAYPEQWTEGLLTYDEFITEVNSIAGIQ